MGGRSQDLRQYIAREAARLMVEGGVEDFELAKRKAIERLRVESKRDLPGNAEIEEARLEYQRLFRSDDQPRHLESRRRAAVQAMKLLSDFRPRLVGSVLSGSADEHSRVVLHLLGDPPESVALFLDARGIAHRTLDARVRFGPKDPGRVPAVRFMAGDVEIELLVFGEREWRRPPLSPVDGRAMKRAGLAEVAALVADG